MYVLQLQSQYEFITFHNSIQMLTLLTKLLTFMLNLGFFNNKKQNKQKTTKNTKNISQAAARPRAPAAPMRFGI